jgi:putative membrane protein
MSIWNMAKVALLLFWLVALGNLVLPFAEPLSRLAGIILLVHVAEILLFNRRLQARPNPWLERLQVLLFGFVQIRSLR